MEKFNKFIQFCCRHLSNTAVIKLVIKRYDDCDEKFKSSEHFLQLLNTTTENIENQVERAFVHLRDFLAKLKNNKAVNRGSSKRTRDDSDTDKHAAKKARFLAQRENGEAGLEAGAETTDSNLDSSQHSDLEQRGVPDKEEVESEADNGTTTGGNIKTYRKENTVHPSTSGVSSSSKDQSSKVKPKKGSQKQIKRLDVSKTIYKTAISKHNNSEDVSVIVTDSDTDESDSCIKCTCSKHRGHSKYALSGCGLDSTKHSSPSITKHQKKRNAKSHKDQTSVVIDTSDSNSGTKHTQNQKFLSTESDEVSGKGKSPISSKKLEGAADKLKASTRKLIEERDLVDATCSDSTCNEQSDLENPSVNHDKKRSRIALIIEKLFDKKLKTNIENSEKQGPRQWDNMELNCLDVEGEDENKETPASGGMDHGGMDHGGMDHPHPSTSGLSSSRKDQSSKVKPKNGSQKQIKRLENLLERILDDMERVRERELDLEEMDDETSDYILEDKLQKKFVKVWNKLCQLHEVETTTGLATEKFFRYEADDENKETPASGGMDHPHPSTSGVSSSSKDQSSKVKPKKGSQKQIKRLENLLERFRDEIERVRERELDLEEMDDETSDYILEDKLQKKFVKVWNKLCQLHEVETTTGRATEKFFKYEGTRYPDISNRIQKFVNRRKVFPDYHDIKEIITKVNRDKKLNLRLSKIEDLAREAFIEVGNQLQHRRQQDFLDTFRGNHIDMRSAYDDPALFDPALKKKLEANRKVAKYSLDNVLEKYVRLQENVGDRYEEESDDDDEEEEEAENDNNEMKEKHSLLADNMDISDDEDIAQKKSPPSGEHSGNNSDDTEENSDDDNIGESVERQANVDDMPESDDLPSGSQQDEDIPVIELVNVAGDDYMDDTWATMISSPEQSRISIVQHPADQLEETKYFNNIDLTRTSGVNTDSEERIECITSDENDAVPSLDIATDGKYECINIAGSGENESSTPTAKKVHPTYNDEGDHADNIHENMDVDNEDVIDLDSDNELGVTLECNIMQTNGIVTKTDNNKAARLDETSTEVDNENYDTEGMTSANEFSEVEDDTIIQTESIGQTNDAAVCIHNDKSADDSEEYFVATQLDNNDCIAEEISYKNNPILPETEDKTNSTNTIQSDKITINDGIYLQETQVDNDEDIGNGPEENSLEDKQLSSDRENVCLQGTDLGIANNNEDDDSITSWTDNESSDSDVLCLGGDLDQFNENDNDTSGTSGGYLSKSQKQAATQKLQHTATNEKFIRLNTDRELETPVGEPDWKLPDENIYLIETDYEETEPPIELSDSDGLKLDGR